MKRRSALVCSFICLLPISSSIVFAEDKSLVAPTASVASMEENVLAELTDAPSMGESIPAEPPKTTIQHLLHLLMERNVISEEEAATIGKQPEAGMQQENINALLNLLQAKGVISVEEAGNLADAANPSAAAKKVTGPAGRNTATMPLILPMDDRRFLQVLKDKWLEIGKKIDDFYPTFNDSRDPEYIIGRMKELEIITDDEAYDLTRQYRSNYLSGAVSATLENKEKGYMDRIAKEVTADLDKAILPIIRNDWTQRLKFSGDLRLRYEGAFFDKDNAQGLARPDNPSQALNTTHDRNRFLVRARLGLEARVYDELYAGIRLATGNTTNPVSTNATMGDSLNKKNFLLDQAYLKWSPDPSLSVWGGRFPNPWFYTDLVWDQDLNFEGVAVQYRPRLTESWGLFFNGGVFPLQEVELSSRDKWLLGAQAGAEYRVKDKLTARLGAALYLFENTVGKVNPDGQTVNDFTAPQFQQKGNTLMDINGTVGATEKMAYASRFKELNITGTLDLAYWNPIHIILTGDYVNNLGFDKAAVDSRTGADIKEETQGYQFSMAVGTRSVQKLWDWKAHFAYKYLEADAVMDAFTDSDFHLGGTNAKGWIIGGDLGVAKNTWLSTRWLSANEISGDFPLAIDVFQFNINAKF